MICIPIIANNLVGALHDMTEASKVADIVELRIDYIKGVDLKRLLEKRTKPVIVTNRPVREGGKFNGSEEERIAAVEDYREKFANPYRAAALGYIDEIIMPQDTRYKIIQALNMTHNKRKSNLPRKHGNIPL